MWMGSPIQAIAKLIVHSIHVFILWEIENLISGAADRTRQHDAVMAFINGHL